MLKLSVLSLVCVCLSGCVTAESITGGVAAVMGVVELLRLIGVM